MARLLSVMLFFVGDSGEKSSRLAQAGPTRNNKFRIATVVLLNVHPHKDIYHNTKRVSKTDGNVAWHAGAGAACTRMTGAWWGEIPPFFCWACELHARRVTDRQKHITRTTTFLKLLEILP